MAPPFALFTSTRYSHRPTDVARARGPGPGSGVGRRVRVRVVAGVATVLLLFFLAFHSFSSLALLCRSAPNSVQRICFNYLFPRPWRVVRRSRAGRRGRGPIGQMGQARQAGQEGQDSAEWANRPFSEKAHFKGVPAESEEGEGNREGGLDQGGTRGEGTQARGKERESGQGQGSAQENEAGAGMRGKAASADEVTGAQGADGGTGKGSRGGQEPSKEGPLPTVQRPLKAEHGEGKASEGVGGKGEQESEAEKRETDKGGEAWRSVSVEEVRKAVAGMGLQGRPVFATISNKFFNDMLLNWVAHLRKLGLSNLILVGALDKPTVQLCEHDNIGHIVVRADLPEEDFRGNVKFKTMGVSKVELLHALLSLGHDVVLSDTDTVWLRDPLPFLIGSPGDPSQQDPTLDMIPADILVTTDSLSYSNEVATLADPNPTSTWFSHATRRAMEPLGNAYLATLNTGVLMFRCRNPIAVQLAKTWLDALRTEGKSMNWTDYVWDDQDVFNRLLGAWHYPLEVAEPWEGHLRNNRVLWGWQHRLRLGILPLSLFANGHVFFMQQVHRRNALPLPLAVHNTFQFYKMHGKLIRFREFFMWELDPPSYYKDGNFLSFDAALPSCVYSRETQSDHFVTSFGYYYNAVRNALAMATILDRILILPNFTCLCDRYWYETLKPCRLPGVDVDPPYTNCPADVVFNMITWDQSSFPYRAFTFLNHPRTPAAIKSSRVEVEVVPRALWHGAAASASVQIPELATESELRSVLGSVQLKDTRVLHLSKASTAFCRFDAAEDNVRFDQRTLGAEMFGQERWCCEPLDHLEHRYFNRPPPLASVTPETCALPPLSECIDTGEDREKVQKGL